MRLSAPYAQCDSSSFLGFKAIQPSWVTVLVQEDFPINDDCDHIKRVTPLQVIPLSEDTIICTMSTDESFSANDAYGLFYLDRKTGRILEQSSILNFDSTTFVDPSQLFISDHTIGFTGCKGKPLRSDVGRPTLFGCQPYQIIFDRNNLDFVS